ncbi:MAG: DUF4301 family protein [Balneolales bacterium]|nr:DUF4301 family protein [Balneolales bacterium]
MKASLEKKLSAQLQEKNISKEEVQRQLDLFKNGVPYLQVERPAIAGDGILKLSDAESVSYKEKYDAIIGNGEIQLKKFVPASGAASRMFKQLESMLLEYSEIDNEVLKKDKENCRFAATFIQNIRKFAFFKLLSEKLSANGLEIEELLKNGEYRPLIEYTLSEAGLSYSSMPKALIQFHQYDNGSRSATALQEQFAEGCAYARMPDSSVRLHFTISPEFLDDVKLQSELIISEWKKKDAGIQFMPEFSFQQPSTDTIAVDENNEPFIDSDGRVLFRPGGHGALIENLNELNTDAVFIKNIDNVVPDHLRDDTIFWKKVIGGVGLNIREEVFAMINKLSEVAGKKADASLLEEAEKLCTEKLNLSLPETYAVAAVENKPHVLIDVLNRPIRVCGMVKNEGEPGGGPFFIKKEGLVNKLQIVESSQLNKDDAGQMKILASSTHFNPVDLFCILKDYSGEAFDLNRFTDPETAFIASKSKDGKSLKALERPGLWNGAMAHWITVFIEVPVSTFNPVKTVNDLLRPQHQ